MIIGRNQKENEFIEKWVDPEDGWARVMGHPGPMALAIGKIGKPEDWEKLAHLCLTYSDAPGDRIVPVQLGQGDREWEIDVTKMGKENLREWMI